MLQALSPPYLLIFLLSLLFIFHKLVTKQIPSRLNPDQAPRTSFGLVQIDGFAKTVTDEGVEQVQHSNVIFLANSNAASSLYMVLGRIPIQPGVRNGRELRRRRQRPEHQTIKTRLTRLSAGYENSYPKTSPRHHAAALVLISGTMIHTGFETRWTPGCQFWAAICCVRSARKFESRER